jgi:hypothetical protein
VAKPKDFYPVILATDPPTLLTRKEVEDYFKKRGTVVKMLHIPATHPREERSGN